MNLPLDESIPAIPCPDIGVEPDVKFGFLRAVDVVAFLSVPLYIEGKLWGFMTSENCFAAREWTEQEIEYASMLGSVIAGAVMRDVYDKKLKEALKNVTAASKAKGEFLSNMSHEMRTPLNAIIGMTTIGSSTNDPERKEYALKKIENASSHLLSVINDVLDMSKIEADMLELSPVEFSFERMLQKVIAIINFRADEKLQTLAVNVDSNVPRFIIGDDKRLSQIITNLLSNAVKFTPDKGKISICAGIDEEVDGVCKLRVVVTDTGIGISEEQQTKLFRAFGQAESGTSRKFGGTGLGLVISKRIVELMGGEIWVDSELGKGASFGFTAKVQRGKKTIRSMLDRGINWETIRILAVDDEESVRDYFKELFAQVDVNCDVAANGEAAYEMIESGGDYDVYFIDWRMPGMDGIELTRKIKRKSSAKKSVVTMISSADWTAIKDEALDAGVDKYLLKPLFSSAIIDCVNDCLGLNGVRGNEIQPTGDSADFAGKRLLLAEDISINREIVMSVLEDTGIEIDCAENGEEAVTMFASSPEKYDIVLMDVQMPKMDGLEATRRIRALPDPNSLKVPIVAMTANVFKHDIEECISAGMNDHISKPLDIDEVFEKLRKHLRK
jgi:signal transduction histidine kinase/CheY-like chemotaxis protein